MRIHDLQLKKIKNEKICTVTCYDYPSARIVAESEIDAVLIGDSVAMVVHGYETTLSATLEMMVWHTQAVIRGIGKQLVITDMPFLSYRGSLNETMNNIRRLMQAGAHAVKLEGVSGNESLITHIVESGVPVMGHLGLIPQSVHQMGGYKVQGRDEQSAQALFDQAKQLESYGCFAIVLEGIPSLLAKEIDQALTIPTIGIGAGPHVSGQILVWHDLLGLQNDLRPKFVKRYCDGADLLKKALNNYCLEITEETFPQTEHSYGEQVHHASF